MTSDSGVAEEEQCRELSGPAHGGSPAFTTFHLVRHLPSHLKWRVPTQGNTRFASNLHGHSAQFLCS
jgi:hypothetical protein